MPNNYITIERDRFEELVIAEREANALKSLLKERKYLGVTGVECVLVCKALGVQEDE